MESEAKAYLYTAISVLITIAVYNTFVKRYTPTGVRNLIGLG